MSETIEKTQQMLAKNHRDGETLTQLMIMESMPLLEGRQARILAKKK